MTGAMIALWSSPERRSVHCVTCAGDRQFEQPVCLDGHEAGECPDWACVECGHLMWFGRLGPAERARPARLLVTAAV
jgi:hypothetical protein